ncbi:MAG: PASTA domain-containing protein [Saprospiraceae bacterium]|nr:PASTA domain-containing protein [Saprospiraceae bacterium]
MPKYIGVSQEEAIKHARKKDFVLLVTDSIFWKGKPGGLIISQIPTAGSMVKEGRSIYVTITKYRAEGLLSSDLPILYGKRFEFKRKELYNNFELYSRVKEIRYDPGPEQHILEVQYKGQVLTDAEKRTDNIEILKGDTLDFVLSTQSGGKVDMPKLRCMNFAEVRFLLNTYKLELSDLQYMSEITDEENAIVVWQYPNPGESIALGSTIQLKIQQDKPADCD